MADHPHYTLRITGLHKTVDIDEAVEAIDTLLDKHQGFVTKEDILHEAAKSNSPLHKAFEWNDRKAAVNYRKHQTVQLMGNIVRAKKNGQPSATKAYVYVQGDTQKKGYVRLETAMRNTSMRNQIVAQAWRELKSFRTRYAGYKELARIVNSIDSQTPDFEAMQPEKRSRTA